jgi:hypothetical protein
VSIWFKEDEDDIMYGDLGDAWEQRKSR